MIIETSANQLFQVTETGRADLAHCWYGVRVKKVRGEFVKCSTERKTAGGRRVNRSFPELVRKAGSRVVVAA